MTDDIRRPNRAKKEKGSVKAKEKETEKERRGTEVEHGLGNRLPALNSCSDSTHAGLTIPTTYIP